MLALLAVAGWFVLNRWDRLFPNAKAVATPAPAQADPIAKARQLHEEGKTAVAIAQLRRIPPGDPSFGEAQSLVSRWEAIEQESEKPTLSAAQAFRRRELIDSARSALADGRHAFARSRLERAGAIAPLTGEEGQLAADVQERLAPFAQELALFKDGEFEFLLNQLWRRREAEKGNRDLDQLLVDSYFNLGVLDLQRGDPAAALDKFREARKLDAEDVVAPAARALRGGLFAQERGSALQDLREVSSNAMSHSTPDEPNLFDLPLAPPPNEAPETVAEEPDEGEAEAPARRPARRRRVDRGAPPEALSLFDEPERRSSTRGGRAERPGPRPLPPPEDEQAEPTGLVPIAVRTRAGAGDLIVLAAVGAIAATGARAMGARIGIEQLPPLFVFLLAWSFVYTVISLAFWGQTPGMAWVGVLARSVDGEPLSFGQTALRWVGGWLTWALAGLPGLLALSGTSLADRLSRSRLYETSEALAEPEVGV